MLSEFNNIIPNFYCEKEKIDNINLDDYKFKIFKSNISILKKNLLIDIQILILTINI